MKAAGSKATAIARKPDRTVWAALVFGSDEGVVADTAQLLLKGWQIAHQDVQLQDEDTIKKDPSSFLDTLEARALLGGDRAVRVRTKGDKISAILLNALKQAEADPDQYAAKLIVEAETLTKKSKLRTGFEAAESAIALHVFEDEISDVSSLIENELANSKVTITPEASTLLSGTLPGHRRLARAEIEKFALYGHRLDRPLDVEDIRALSAADVDHAMAALVDATLCGNLAAALSELDKLTIAGTSEISVLRALLREIARMRDAHLLLDTPGAAEVGMKLRPPVWKSEWPAYRARLGRWSLHRLTLAMARLHDAEADIKKAGGLAASSLRQLIRSFAMAAG